MKEKRNTRTIQYINASNIFKKDKNSWYMVVFFQITEKHDLLRSDKSCSFQNPNLFMSVNRKSFQNLDI